MKAGTIVQYNNDHLGVFLYPHDRVLVDDSICSIFNAFTKKITHVSLKNVKTFKDTCVSRGDKILSDDVYIFDLESWHDYNNCAKLEEDNNYWVKLDKHELVYKAEILDIDFEIYIEELFNNNLKPFIVIDYKSWQVFIYAKICDTEEFSEIINENEVEYEDYNIDYFEF